MLTTELPATRQGSFDAPSGLHHLFHVRELLYEQHCGTQWAANYDADDGGVLFQMVARGACTIDLIELGRSVRLEAGDVAVLPHGDRHIVRAELALTNESHQVETQLIFGRFALELPRENFVLAALPDLIVMRAAENADALELRRLITALEDELDAGCGDARAIANDLASALFMMMVPIHIDRERVVEGLVCILGHRLAARAVKAMLSSPSYAWTLDELASRASASRASLVRMFQKTIGMAPLEFLAELRLGLARRKLYATKLTLAEIAAEIGYQSESAFSRAFRRRFGMPPGEMRASGSC